MLNIYSRPSQDTCNWEYEEISIGDVRHLLNEYDIEVESPDGYVPINFFVDKGLFEEYTLTTSDSVIRCNQDHLFETDKGWKFAKDLVNISESVKFLSRTGYVDGRVEKTGHVIPIVDINVDHENHRYYTENISSHNTGVGKSMMMCHMAAANLLQGKNVLYISLEMAEEKIGERIDENLLDMDVDTLHSTSRGVFMSKIDAIKKKTAGRLIIKEYPTSSAHTGHFRALLNELRLKNGFIPEIIYIDYINIAASARLKKGGSNSYEWVKAIAEEFRSLACEFNVAIVTATQVNRDGYGDTEVDLTNTSESWGLPATCDLMFALVSTEQLEKLMQLLVVQLKNRYNDANNPKRFTIGMDRAKMKLYDIDDPDKTIDSSTPKEEQKSAFGVAKPFASGNSKFAKFKV